MSNAVSIYIRKLIDNSSTILNTLRRKRLSKPVMEVVSSKLIDLYGLSTMLTHLELFLQFVTIEEFEKDLKTISNMDHAAQARQITELQSHYNLFYSMEEEQLSDFKLNIIEQLDKLADEIKDIGVQVEKL